MELPFSQTHKANS